jgi:pimeloyl-ACP methyl ester carboxylesterase
VPLSRAVDGFRLAYDRAGSGPAVVLLHGWPGARSDHAAVARLLARDGDVMVPDLRGFGDTDGAGRGAGGGQRHFSPLQAPEAFAAAIRERL